MIVVVNRHTGTTRVMSEDEFRFHLEAQGKSDDSIDFILKAISNGEMPEGEHEWYRSPR